MEISKIIDAAKLVKEYATLKENNATFHSLAKTATEFTVTVPSLSRSFTVPPDVIKDCVEKYYDTKLKELKSKIDAI